MAFGATRAPRRLGDLCSMRGDPRVGRLWCEEWPLPEPGERRLHALALWRLDGEIYAGSPLPYGEYPATRGVTPLVWIIIDTPERQMWVRDNGWDGGLDYLLSRQPAVRADAPAASAMADEVRAQLDDEDWNTMRRVWLEAMWRDYVEPVADTAGRVLKGVAVVGVAFLAGYLVLGRIGRRP